MNDRPDPTSPRHGDGDDHDPVLSGAGARLRQRSTPISPLSVETAVLRRRTRRLGALAGASLLAVALLGGLLLVRGGDDDPSKAAEVAVTRPGAPAPDEVEQLVAGLSRQPVDPTKVQLVSSVSTFADCDDLIGDLRQVGAEHVGSQGFGGYYQRFQTVGYSLDARTQAAASDSAAATTTFSGAPTDDAGTTLGTNVQVEGVDELDFVKAVGTRIYDLDGKGDLRITDVRTKQVLATLDVTPAAPKGSEGGDPQVTDLLVADGRVAIFGTEVETSKPVEGDPSATRASTGYLTVTMVDATDPAKPTISDRVRVEGSLVSARLVGGEVRLVTGSDMSDLGFVIPTTPNSIAKALEQNRRSVASSTAADWIPDWTRTGEDPQPLVPCDRVHVPDTFSGVSMTSMVTFPMAATFQPVGTSILAPSTTLYAGLDEVAISSEVWVDPIDRGRLEFDDWKTAVHQFSFGDAGEAPGYEGSGIVDGSTIGQFAFGEVGDALGVVTTNGTPWDQNPKKGIDLTLLTPDGEGGLDVTSKVADLAGGKGEVSAVRFVEGRVLVSSGFAGRGIYVIDVSDPTTPRRAGSIALPGSVGYFHPLPDQQALVISSRSDTVGEGDDEQYRPWVQAQLLDVSDADAPKVLQTWERPWASDDVGADHHAFTYWPERKLAMWGLHDQERGDRPNLAAVLSTDGGVTEVAVPQASKPNEVPSPCPSVPVTDAEARQMIGRGGVALRCEKGTEEVTWPRYECYGIDRQTVARFAPGQEDSGSFFACSPAPQPTVSRVLVVDGTPMLLTDQTLETLDPTTFASTSITFFPSGGRYRGEY